MKLEDIKEKLLEQIKVLRDIVEMEDIPMLINIIQDMGFSKTGHSCVYCYTRELLIEFISEYMKSRGLNTFRVNRKGEYGTDTFDTYQICKDGLFRNGHTTKWDSIGKLYQAYVKIKSIKL